MLKQAYYAAGSVLARIERQADLGTNIYDAEWDICILLDSARYDLLRELAPDYPALPEVESRWSVGSVTTEWLTNTFSKRRLADVRQTSMVTASPHSQTVFRDSSWLTSPEPAERLFPESPSVGPGDFESFHELWRSHATFENVVPPETMRHATLEAHQESDRVVAHWMQPHEPFIAADAPMVGGAATESNVWDGLQSGDLQPTTVWESYRATLAMALEEVQTLLKSVDATVLITADHGNAFGEWGIYGHPFGWPQPAVRKVPWVVVDANATQDAPDTSVLEEADTNESSREEQLSALGYL